MKLTLPPTKHKYLIGYELKTDDNNFKIVEEAFEPEKAIQMLKGWKRDFPAHRWQIVKKITSFARVNFDEDSETILGDFPAEIS